MPLPIEASFTGGILRGLAEIREREGSQVIWQPLEESGFPAVQTRRLRRRRPNIPRMAAANPGMVPASAGRGAAPRDSAVVP